MGLGVDAASHPADHHGTVGQKTLHQLPAGLKRVRGSRPGADDSDPRAAMSQQLPRTAAIEAARRIKELIQTFGKKRVQKGKVREG
jgi:hypothetical protein